MAINNFPQSLHGVIQTGYLEREFEAGLSSLLGFRAIADRETFPNGIGETLTKTRMGLKPPVTTPLNPQQNTNFDNGLTSTSQAIEQYTYGIDQYGDTIDLNMVTSQVGLASLFVQNARTNGEQAVQSLDCLARNVLFGGATGGVGGYLGGNTRVTVAATGSSNTLQVDDIRGFERGVLSSGGATKGGVVTPIGVNGFTVAVAVGQTAYQLVGVTSDIINVSTAPGGQSGTLTFTANVSASDGAAGNPVVHSAAPLVVRPNGKKTTAQLTAGGANATVDTLTMNDILAASGALRSNNVPMVNGAYHCYIDNQQLNGLFRDPDFKLLYRGQYNSETYRTGDVFELLGVRFIPTTQSPQQASLGAGKIHRAVVVGAGALIEGDFAGIAHSDLGGGQNHVVVHDGVALINRPPLDRLGQIIAQSWYWIGGFALPTDVTADTTIIPTASNSYLKRAVVLESLGTDMYQPPVTGN